ncbi:MAG: Lrp/AsnC family transcriptional regulator [Thermomicrobiales bacterium]
MRRIEVMIDVGQGNSMAQEHSDSVRKVLRALEMDARRTPAQIAALAGVSEDEAAAIVGDLESRGIIRAYRTVIDWERVMPDRVIAFIDVSVTPQRDVGFDQVAARIYRHPEVRSVHLVSGGHDLRVVVEGPTIREISQFVGEKLAPIDNVTATNTHFLLRAYKEDGIILTEDPDDDDRLAVTP